MEKAKYYQIKKSLIIGLLLGSLLGTELQTTSIFAEESINTQKEAASESSGELKEPVVQQNESLGDNLFIDPHGVSANPYPMMQTLDGVTTVRCTYYAWQQAYERLGINLPAWGNAKDWYNNARNDGYSVGQTAQANSIAVYDGIKYPEYGHVQFVTAVNGSSMTVNTGGYAPNAASTQGIANSLQVSSEIGSSDGWTSLKGFIYLEDHNPKGYIDEIKSENYGEIYIRGWAFDPDEKNVSTSVHIYLCNDSGNADCFIGAFDANQRSSDVNSAFGIKGKHRFSGRIKLNELTANSFNQYIEKIKNGSKVTLAVFAINRGAGSVNSPCDWGVSNKIKVKWETTAPVISNVKVSDVSSSGYTVTCTITERSGLSKVEFPTWTEKNGQDDLKSPWVTGTYKSNGNNKYTATYQVKASQHNKETGKYITHIYATDILGNVGKWSSLEVDVVTSVTAVNLNKSTLSLGVGDSLQLTATISPANATDKSVTWTSNDPSVATVTTDGKIVAKGVGKATITVTTNDRNKSATCKVTVKNTTIETTSQSIPVKSISFKYQVLTLHLGQSAFGPLDIIFSPSDASNKTVTWGSSDPTVATVSNGVISPITAGSTLITATATDGGYIARCNVTVKKSDPTSQDSATNIHIATKQKLDVKPYFDTAYEKYHISPEGSATINAQGILTVKKPGEITISGLIYMRSKKGWWVDSENAIHVVAKTPQFSNKTITLSYLGESMNIADNLEVSSLEATSWVVSNTKVVSFDAATNTITAKKRGTTKVTAIFGTGKNAAKYSYTVKVTLPSISKKKATLLTGGTLALKLNRATGDIDWESSDEDIASVDENGTITALSAGTAKITASLNGTDYVCAITVKKPTLSAKKATLAVGKTKKLTLKNTKLTDIDWSSSDEDIAEVTIDGVIHAIAPGKVQISTTSGGCTDVCVVTVK